MAELNLGEAVYKQGKAEEAITHFRRPSNSSLTRHTVRSSLGVALLEMGRPEESRAPLQAALEIDPNDGDAHYNLGNTLLQMGRAKEAVTHYDNALKINPDDKEALNNMAWVLATSDAPRDGTKAVQLAEKAAALTQGGSPMINATLAAAYAEAGRFESAVKAAQRALQQATEQGNATRANSIRGQIEFYQRACGVSGERQKTL